MTCSVLGDIIFLNTGYEINYMRQCISPLISVGKNVNIEWSCGHHGYIDIKWFNQFVEEEEKDDDKLLVAVSKHFPLPCIT